MTDEERLAKIRLETIEREMKWWHLSAKAPAGMKPQYKPLHEAATYYALQQRVFQEHGSPPADLNAMYRLLEAALAYARPIVASSCAEIVAEMARDRAMIAAEHNDAEEWDIAELFEAEAAVLRAAEASIRDHGRSK